MIQHQGFPTVYVPQRRCKVGPDGPSDWRPVGHSQFFKTKEDALSYINKFKGESVPELVEITDFRILIMTVSNLFAVL